MPDDGFNLLCVEGNPTSDELMRIPTSHPLLSCLVALLLLAPGSQAQTLLGVVLDETAGVAIQGARLLLLDGADDVVGTTLSYVLSA